MASVINSMPKVAAVHHEPSVHRSARADTAQACEGYHGAGGG
jgi:hypothetical protein